ncbi:MAG: metallophosphoesterase, partial [Myxococcota bacterium]
MLTFSNDPKVAEQQMRAIIFYLTTFGCIDGDFDASEREYVRNYIRGLVRKRIDTGMPEADEAVRNELEEKFFAHFMEVFEGIDRHVKDLFTESVAKDEDQEAFVHAKLKLRCFEIFESFDAKNKDSLMDTVDELIAADGHVHPAELKFRNELAELLEADLNVELVEDGARPSLEVRLPTALAPPAEGHPFFQQFEFHYSAQKDMILKQVEADRALLKRASEVWKTQRAAGAGRLAGKSSVGEFAAGERFLDEFTYVVRPEPGKQYDLTVLGDLHGCYSNLKAAVLQARFFEKVEAFRNDPANAPEPMLVLLGDYIDRGMFSLNGVLRTVLQLFVTAPEHVYVLRGNHEYYVEYKGRVYGGVKPAEAINTLKPHVDEDVFRDYMRLFEEMPNVLLFNGLMMVHG